MKENMHHSDLPPDALDGAQITCPHCHFEFKINEITYTMKNGFFRCPVCDKKFSPSSTHNQSSPAPSNPVHHYFVPVLVILGIISAVTVIYFVTSVNQKAPAPVAVTSVIIPRPITPSRDQAIDPPAAPAIPATAPVLPDNNVLQGAQPLPKNLDKMQIVKAIAAMYHASHSYTMAGGFVCLDMATDVWNQLRTYGIDAKIMGGIITENITAWNYRKLAMESNHAWVVATLSPTEKVAIETTEGKVIKPEMENASVYFKGIEFDTPAQIKKFEFFRRKTYESCQEAHQLINHWNENFAGKQQKYEDAIARQSQIENRKRDCESNFNELKAFEAKAIFY